MTQHFPSMSNNIAFLTQSHKAIAAKKKVKLNQIKEVIFDDEARRWANSIPILFSALIFLLSEFLTGFHKRKLAKTQAARSKAKEREKKERLEARREVLLCLYVILLSALTPCIQQRRMLREKAIENAAQVEKAYGGLVGWWLFNLRIFDQQSITT